MTVREVLKRLSALEQFSVRRARDWDDNTLADESDVPILRVVAVDPEEEEILQKLGQ